MKKRLLSTLLVLCMTVTMLPVSVLAATPTLRVLGFDVTSANKDDVLGGADGEAATVRYDPDSKTLTLDGVNIISPDGTQYVIQASYLEPLTIELVGKNSVTMGTVTEHNSYAVFGENSDIVISGDGELTVQGGNVDNYITGVSSAGIHARNLTINSGTVFAKSGEAPGICVGIYTTSSLKLNGGTITMSGENRVIAIGSLLDVSDYADVQITASYHPDGRDPAVYVPSEINNYKYIRFAPPTDYSVVVDSAKDVVQGSGLSSLPTANSGMVEGSLTWYSDSGYATTASDTDISDLDVGESVTLFWNFTATTEGYVRTPKIGECQVTIVSGAAQALSFSESSVTKTVGDGTFTNPLTHSVGTGAVVTYSSSNESVATVASNGTVTILGAGTTTITANASMVPGEFASGSASYTLTVNDVPMHTVTFLPNGGTVGETSRPVTSGEAVGTLPTPTRPGSYSFNGWYTEASGGMRIDEKTTVSNDVTYYAQWTHTGGGGSGSGGGSPSNDSSSNVIVTVPTPDRPNSPTQGEIRVPGTVDDRGNVIVSITNSDVTEAFDKALADARNSGMDENGITVVLRADSGSRTGSGITVNLPKAVQDTIITKGIANTIVVVESPDIRVDMDLASVKEINRQAKSDVSITATPTDTGRLTPEARSVIGSRPVFDLRVNYGNGNTVSSFSAGSVSVTIPYTPAENEKPENIRAVYVDSNGRVHWLTNSVYDRDEKVLRFSTGHFSTYGVGYRQTDMAFTDIAGHWAEDSIEFVVNRGLFSGTSSTAFSPNIPMTRGMFVTVLGQLANADISGYTESSFSDVKSDAYYRGYIEWASRNSIVKGVGNGRFAPDQAITREQMAVIISSYARAIGYALPEVHAENSFSDNGKISTYAREAVKELQTAGVISGRNNSLFDPQGTATRAEASAVLSGFVELAVSGGAMQSWTMNGSGRWMYYENGTPVTGNKDIEGSTYTFDRYGATQDVPKNLRYTTYTVQSGDSFWSISRKLGCSTSELERLNNRSRFSIIFPGDVLRVPEK